MIGWAIKMCLKHNADCDLFSDQFLHGMRISDPRQSTVDESNASDSVHLKACELVLPGNVYSRVNKTRSPFILLKCPVSDRQTYYPSIKVSSMGNGFTFEILSLLNLAVARLHDADASTFGDDVIINNKYADAFVQDIQALGFIINTKKSFINSPLRESCGAFFLDGFGYITCFDIKYCHNMHDVIITMGKILRIVGLNRGWNHKLKDDLTHLWADILPKIPNAFLGPLRFKKETQFSGLPNFNPLTIKSVVRSGKNESTTFRYSKVSTIYDHLQLTMDLPEWVECGDYIKRSKRSNQCREARKRNLAYLEKLSADYQISSGDLHIVATLDSVPKVRQKPVNIVKNIPLMYAYLWAGRRTPMTYRHNSTWRLRYQVVDSIGNTIQ
uniref:RNA-directed RNA polymerase n=1 Tax=Cope virus TaxID=2707209 RepID=A0A6H0DII5_9VIRU|nr:MAG: RNA-dependent RNA polymerase [Cope virus]